MMEISRRIAAVTEGYCGNKFSGIEAPSIFPENIWRNDKSRCLLANLNISLLMNPKMASASEGVSNFPASFVENCSSTVMRSGLGASMAELSMGRRSWSASRYRYGDFIHRWAQSSKKVATLSDSSVRVAPSGASVPAPRQVVGRESSHRSTSSESS